MSELRDIHVRVTQEEYDALHRLTGGTNFTAAVVALARWELEDVPMDHEVEQCHKYIVEQARAIEAGRRKRGDE